MVLVASIDISAGCDDIESQLCSDLIEKYPGFCSDSCLSQICQRSCGLCAVKCYECHGVDEPKNCSTIVECPSKNHNCFTTQSFADDFRRIYKLGCATRTLCTNYFGTSRKRGLRVDAACCPYDKCNNLTPEEIEYEKTQHQITTPKAPSGVSSLLDDCRNIDDSLCQRIAFLKPNFCHTDDCIAKKLCPLMCGNCFRCYNCIDIDTIDHCNTTTTCSDSKQCFSLETLSFDFRPVYRLGCMDITLCERFKVPPGHIFGKRDSLQLKGGCCHSDLCNNNVVLTSTSTTTTTPRLTTPACPDHFHQTSCPPEFINYHHRCYYLGNITLTWADSKATCESKCGSLVYFDSVSEMDHLLRVLLLHGLHGISHGTQWWTDGHYQSGSWNWDSTGSPISTDLTGNLKLITNRHMTHCVLAVDRHSLKSELCTEKHYPLCILK